VREVFLSVSVTFSCVLFLGFMSHLPRFCSNLTVFSLLHNTQNVCNGVAAGSGIGNGGGSGGNSAIGS